MRYRGWDRRDGAADCYQEVGITEATWEGGQIEGIDEARAEVLWCKTPVERLKIVLGLWRSARKLLLGQLALLHPEWDARQLEREVAWRFSQRAISKGLS
ncbi:MAG: hypothetical protein CV088_09825 [Nitrospira sp. LK70]|nr:hypothetical protein [Nitrospira sp. LK70]